MSTYDSALLRFAARRAALGLEARERERGDRRELLLRDRSARVIALHAAVAHGSFDECCRFTRTVLEKRAMRRSSVAQWLRHGPPQRLTGARRSQAKLLHQALVTAK
jgi:hypothetical protein